MADMMAMTIDVSAKNFRSMENAADKSLSCPVCGKNFPRGAVDLDRHCSAKTLSHFAASQKITGLFTFKCSCNIYFTSEAHLELHKKTICICECRIQRIRHFVLRRGGHEYKTNTASVVYRSFSI